MSDDEDDDLFADSDSDGNDTDDLIAESKKASAAAAKASPKKPVAKKKIIKKKSAASTSASGDKRKRIPGMLIICIGCGFPFSRGRCAAPCPILPFFLLRFHEPILLPRYHIYDWIFYSPPISPSLSSFSLCIQSTDADNDDDDSDDDLFKDSDGDDDDDDDAGRQQPMTKRQRMDALQAKKRKEQQKHMVSSVPRGRGDSKKGDTGNNDNDDESMNSADYVRTQEDNDFIDTEGDDAEAVAELYADQHFDDDRLEDMEDDMERRKKGGSSGRKNAGRSEASILKSEADQDNPLVQAMLKLQKKKKEEKTSTEIMEIVKPFLDKMMDAAVEDEEAMERKQPAVKKLNMLQEVYDTIVNVELQNELLDEHLLTFCKRWIQPLKNGKLGNVTVRKKIIQALSTIKPGTDKRGNKIIRDRHGITKEHLKESGFGKVCMALAKHKDETPEMKKLLKQLMDHWFRDIFGKSGNMKDVDQRVRGQTGVAAYNRQQFLEKEAAKKANACPSKASRGGRDQNLDSILQKGSQGKSQNAQNRVSVPFSKGFAYSVRPDSKLTPQDIRQAAASSMHSEDARSKLAKRMVEKKRTKSKNQRSANISIEGRAVK